MEQSLNSWNTLRLTNGIEIALLEPPVGAPAQSSAGLVILPCIEEPVAESVADTPLIPVMSPGTAMDLRLAVPGKHTFRIRHRPHR